MAPLLTQQYWPGRITIADPVRLINEIARRYETLERVVMEYIDNAIDDADDMAEKNNGKYPYQIKINIIIDRESKRVIIKDNCRGMDFNTLSRIVHKIGESQKRACPWLNGQFGFGVHAFRGFCNEIIFRTKHKDDLHYVLKIYKDSLDVKKPFLDSGTFHSNTGTGTVVTLQKFDEDFFDGLTVEIIKEEIETHFETLLRKANLSIQVGYRNDKNLQCEPYAYDRIPGEAFHKKENIKHLGIEYPIDIFLKVADVPVTAESRRPRFFSKGRRILFIKDDKSFINKSKYRTIVWDHTNLAGYIEVGNLVEPVITRDTFQRGKGRSLLYDTILQLEEEIKLAIDEINKKYEDHSLNQLEDVIGRALRKLAREDALKFKVDYVVGGDDTTLALGGGSATVGDLGGPIGKRGGSGLETPHLGEGPFEGPSGEGKGNLQGFGEGGPLPKEGDSDYQGTRRKSSGFSIQFKNIPADIDGNYMRSDFANGSIIVNMEHPDFKERFERTRKGELKVTERMVSYVAAVISIHYKDQYYEKYHNQPESRTDLFDEQVEFVFRLERTLLPFIKEIKSMMLSTELEQQV
ncbi:MAG: ATP-binding protein [bacterium]